ncbi:hypothetical protein NL676_001280 [Syzygium grande]|nr:hypothetical protein NL676_001280 [Syzygium grande]
MDSSALSLGFVTPPANRRGDLPPGYRTFTLPPRTPCTASIIAPSVNRRGDLPPRRRTFAFTESAPPCVMSRYVGNAVSIAKLGNAD